MTKTLDGGKTCVFAGVDDDSWKPELGMEAVTPNWVLLRPFGGGVLLQSRAPNPLPKGALAGRREESVLQICISVAKAIN